MIELNGIQISDNNINTKKNVKIYVDEKQLNNKVGELSDLKTTDKSSIVNAINEVKDTTDTLQVDVNRIYSDFTIIPNTPTEQEFTYKKSDEGVIEKGVAVIDKVKGNSVVWNQLIDKIFSYNSGTSVDVTNKNGIVTIVVPEGGIIEKTIIFCPKINTIIGHKYLVSGGLSSQSYFTFGNASSYGEGGIYTENIVGRYGYIYLQVGTPAGTYKLRPLVYDLTQMFGTGNEPSTYEEFLSRKPKVADEYAYNEGTIVNNKVEKVVTTGINLWDEQWELGTIAWSGIEVVNNTRIRSSFVPIFANTTYYLRCGSVRYEIFFYDANKSFISYNPSSVANGAFTTPKGAVYLRFTTNSNYTETTYAHDICINLSNPAINGKYFPYEKHELDLSWIKNIKDVEGVKLFEDGMKSTRTAFDEATKGRAIKRIGVVNLGNLNWTPGVQTGQYQASDFQQLRPSKNKSLVCANYTTHENGTNLQDDSKDLWVWNNVGRNSGYYGNVLVAKDTRYSSAQAFKQAVQGVLLYYELAEPIEVEYDEKSLTYPVIAGGTEEAIASEPSTPMRASITYGSNTVATILSLMNRVNELERKIIN